MSDVRVLVVEDEELIAEAHRAYTERVTGFRVVGVARTARDALRALRRTGDDAVDLVLLDLHLPDMPGLDLCRAMRAAGNDADVLAVTSARDLAMVRAAVALGVTHYLLKPFTFAAFRDKLERYAEYRRQTSAGGAVAAQHEVDRMLATLRGTAPGTLPKGSSRRPSTPCWTCCAAGPGSPPPRSPNTPGCPASPPGATWNTSPTPAG